MVANLLLLHQLRPESKALSFGFFSKRMDVFAAESTYYKKKFGWHPFPTGNFERAGTSECTYDFKPEPDGNKWSYLFK